MSLVYVLSCFISSGDPDMLLTTDSVRSTIVHISSVLRPIDCAPLFRYLEHKDEGFYVIKIVLYITPVTTEWMINKMNA